MKLESNADVERLIFLTMEGDVIRSLLSGNDTQCFTTTQYEDGRDAWISQMTGSTREKLGMTRPAQEFARKQLRGSGLVVEVSADVWTLKSLRVQAEKGAQG